MPSGNLRVMLLWLLLLGTLVAAGGCTTIPTVQVIRPPESLLEPCSVTDHSIQTNGDLARAYRTAKDELLECSSRLDAIRGWSDQQR